MTSTTDRSTCRSCACDASARPIRGTRATSVPNAARGTCGGAQARRECPGSQNHRSPQATAGELQGAETRLFCRGTSTQYHGEGQEEHPERPLPRQLKGRAMTSARSILDRIIGKIAATGIVRTSMQRRADHLVGLLRTLISERGEASGAALAPGARLRCTAGSTRPGACIFSKRSRAISRPIAKRCCRRRSPTITNLRPPTSRRCSAWRSLRARKSSAE
jgi:hypothetical protein